MRHRFRPRGHQFQKVIIVTVVVTGASGHVGGTLVRALLDGGRKVRALVYRDTRALEGLALDRVEADVIDRVSLVRAFRGANLVYHLAARISITGDDSGEVERVNVGGTRNVVSACRECGVRRLVHFSSIHALRQEPFDRPIDESRPGVGREAPAYDFSKARAEAVALDGNGDGLEVVVVNPTAVIGPGDFKLSAMGQVFLDLYHRRLPGMVDGGFNWVDVRDAVAGAISAARDGRPGESYLLGGHWHSIPELARMGQQVAGFRPPRLTAPMWLARLAAPLALVAARLMRTRPLITPESMNALAFNPRVDSGKAERELGHRARPVAESVKDTYRWFAAHGMLDS